MAATAAMLEFLVIGSIWAGLALIILSAIPELGSGALFVGKPWFIDTVMIPWIIIPGTYAMGIVAQTLTWRWWYMPRIHNPDLVKEISSHRRDQYNFVFKTMKMRGFTFLGLPDDLKSLKDGSHLGLFLDALRWEIFASSHQELARQYLLQFHLYRISYGILPPISISVFIFPAIGAALLFQGNSANLAFLFFIGTFVSLILMLSARISATHRRRRSWKYLVMSMNAILQPGKLLS